MSGHFLRVRADVFKELSGFDPRVVTFRRLLSGLRLLDRLAHGGVKAGGTVRLRAHMRSRGASAGLMLTP